MISIYHRKTSRKSDRSLLGTSLIKPTSLRFQSLNPNIVIGKIKPKYGR